MVDQADPDLLACLVESGQQPPSLLTGLMVSDGMTNSGRDFGFDNALASLTPALEYRMDACSWNGINGEVLDSSGNGLHGTAVNGATTTGSARINRAGGFSAGSLHYVNAGDVLNNIFGNSSSAFTLTTWVQPGTLSTATTNHQTQNVIMAKGSTGYNDNLEVGINANGTVHVYLDTQGSDYYADFGTAGDITVGSWHFIAVTYNGSAVTVYIDDKVYTNTATWSGGGLI
ncbi:MAG: LamG-like jellyroll fold domain-containing protein, partial [Thiolinea sp.]